MLLMPSALDNFGLCYSRSFMEQVGQSEFLL